LEICWRNSLKNFNIFFEKILSTVSIAVLSATDLKSRPIKIIWDRFLHLILRIFKFLDYFIFLLHNPEQCKLAVIYLGMIKSHYQWVSENRLLWKNLSAIFLLNSSVNGTPDSSCKASVQILVLNDFLYVSRRNQTNSWCRSKKIGLM